MKCTTSGTNITFTFDGLEPMVFDAAQCTALAERAAMHGFEQRIRDNAAISRKQKDGTVITVTEDMRRAAVLEMVEHLHKNQTWEMKERKSAQNPAVVALAQKRGISYEAALTELAQAALAEI